MREPLPARKSVRLATANYVSGVYLVTIVTHRRRMTLGRISAGIARHSPLGDLVDEEIRTLPDRRDRVGVEESVVMPNHVHMVVWLAHERNADDIADATLEDDSPGSVIGGFKAGVTGRAHRQGLVPARQPVWQRGFHESILRTEQSITDACSYVERNPELWRWDPMRDG